LYELTHSTGNAEEASAREGDKTQAPPKAVVGKKRSTKDVDDADDVDADASPKKKGGRKGRAAAIAVETMANETAADDTGAADDEQTPAPKKRNAGDRKGKAVTEATGESADNEGETAAGEQAEESSKPEPRKCERARKSGAAKGKGKKVGTEVEGAEHEGAPVEREPKADESREKLLEEAAEAAQETVTVAKVDAEAAT
jgi:hypothetical protein